MTENQKINIAYGLALLFILFIFGTGGFVGYLFGYGHGRNAAIAEYVTSNILIQAVRMIFEKLIAAD